MLDRYLRIGLRETGDTKGFSVSSIFGFYLTRADLRHSHASLLVEMGFSPLEISNRLGHESVKTTLDTYSHLYPDKDRQLADRLDKLRQTPFQE